MTSPSGIPFPSLPTQTSTLTQKFMSLKEFTTSAGFVFISIVRNTDSFLVILAALGYDNLETTLTCTSCRVEIVQYLLKRNECDDDMLQKDVFHLTRGKSKLTNSCISLLSHIFSVNLLVWNEQIYNSTKCTAEGILYSKDKDVQYVHNFDPSHFAGKKTLHFVWNGMDASMSHFDLLHSFDIQQNPILLLKDDMLSNWSDLGCRLSTSVCKL